MIEGILLAASLIRSRLSIRRSGVVCLRHHLDTLRAAAERTPLLRLLVNLIADRPSCTHANPLSQPLYGLLR